MKKIVFLTCHKGLQGSYLNHLDLQQYLKDRLGYKVKFYCENVKKLFQLVKDSRRSYTFEKGEVKLLRKDVIENCTVITDFKTMLMIHKLGYWVICKKLIVMDSIELCYHLKDMKNARFYSYIDVNKTMNQFYTKETLFLMPPNNHEIFKRKYPHLNSQVYFKNINIDMIDTIECENRDGYFYRWDDLKGYEDDVLNKFGDHGINHEPDWNLQMGRKIPVKYNEVDHIFDYKQLVYRRRKYLEYQEQFGRLIFEYILLGKTVYFANEPYTDDGLTDYLIHYNIQFDSNNKITTTKKELQNIMKRNNIDDRLL